LYNHLGLLGKLSELCSKCVLHTETQWLKCKATG